MLTKIFKWLPHKRKPEKPGSGLSWADTSEYLFFTTNFDDAFRREGVEEKERFHVTLIHGTFAREADWIGPNSKLAMQLDTEARERGLKLEIHPFRWSGGLSFSARRKDAVRLHEHLALLISQHPEAEHCAIAHSHGGTILMQALGADVGLQKAMRRVMCISTPFLRVSETSQDWRFGFKLGVQAIAAIFLLVMALGLRIAGPSEAWLNSQPGWTSLSVRVLCATVLIAWFALVLDYLLGKIDVIFDRWLTYAHETFRMTNYPQLRRDQALLIRTAADEASFVLGLGATLAWVFERIAVSLMLLCMLPYGQLAASYSIRKGWAVRLFHGILMPSGCIAILGALYALLMPLPEFRAHGYYVLAAVGAFFIPGLIALMFGILGGLVNAGFGLEIALCAPFVRGTAEVSPLGIWQVFQVPDMRMLPLWKLHHSLIYEAADTRTAIAIWILSGTFSSKMEWRE